jgi:hypothetical protein
MNTIVYLVTESRADYKGIIEPSVAKVAARSILRFSERGFAFY